MIAGTLVATQASVTVASFVPQAEPATSPFDGLTVKVAGTDRSAIVGAAGSFQIQDVPAGNVRLEFTSTTVNASATVANVGDNQFIELQVRVSSTSAAVLSESRSPKVSLCHAEGNGTYHAIDISASAEATHRSHGDAMVGEDVPGRPGKWFDSACKPIGPAIDIEKSTNGADADTPPGPAITVGGPVTWRYLVTNTGSVALTGVAVSDDKGVAVDCGSQTTLAPAASMTCTGTGLVTTVGQYRNVGTATANWANGTRSGSVTDADASHYLGVTPIEIEKFTNGEDADTAPGPSIVVGTAIAWEYRLKNIGTVNLTGIVVDDDRGVAVSCGGQTSLAPGASMTCTGSGVAALGQYRNVGTVRANWSVGSVSGSVTDSDPSHYLGVIDEEDDGESGKKVTLCHRTGAGFYVQISVGASAEPAHRAHGDGKIGETVPGLPGKTFGSGCSVR